MSSSEHGSPQLRALLVAVNEYDADSVPDLAGCENDIQAIETLLKNRFGVLPENICTRANAEATRDGIIGAFRSHLIGHAEERSQSGEPQPGFLYYFSGHGSQASTLRATEDQRVETTVPSDSRTNGVHDIKDWELGNLIKELGEHTENITIILDCCHSGSGTRTVSHVDENGNLIREDIELGQTEVKMRGCEPDLDDPSAEPATDHTPPDGAGTRGTEDESHVLLAGCANHQKSHETAWPTTDEATGKQRRVRHGAMTYFLVRELQQMRPDRRLTYHELHQRLQRLVNNTFDSQIPQCEGDRDREVFGGVRPQTDAFFAASIDKDGNCQVDGGLVHGLAAGSVLAIYPRETRLIADAGDPIGHWKVVSPGAVKSGCVAERQAFELPEDAKAAISRVVPGNMMRRVAIAIDDDDTRSAVEAELADDQVAPYVQTVAAGEIGEYRLALSADTDGSPRLEIQDGSGVRLVAPYRPDNAGALARDLAHLARYKNLLELRNEDPASRLSDTIELRVLHQVFNDDGSAAETGLGSPKFEAVAESAAGELEIRAGDRMAIEMKNTSDRPLFVTLFSLDCAYAIGRVYPPRGTQKAIQPGKKFIDGQREHESDKTAIQFGFPGNWPASMGEGVEYLKVIATEQWTDLESLKQGELRHPFEKTRSVSTGAASPLDAMVAAAMQGGRLAAREDEEPAAENNDWTTAELRYRLLRPG
ncbi:MAG: caspase family protein [Verrucomicrobiales bacterium]